MLFVADTSETNAAKCCILHIDQKGKESSEGILSFNADPWAIVQRTSIIRGEKKNFSTSRYCNVIKSLPSESTETDGLVVGATVDVTRTSLQFLRGLW